MSSAGKTKTVLITGCTPGGIGYALAKAFHARGLLVIATARREEIVEGLRTEGLVALSLDVTNEESIQSCRDNVAEITGGGLDILVNNAGLSHTIPAIDIELPDVRTTFETNVFGIMAMVKAFSRLLIKSRGRIINMSSVASVFPYVYGSIFCATKGAINSYSRTLRQELRPFGVGVTVVMAGFVKTETRKMYRALPEDSVYAVVEDLFRDKLVYSEKRSEMTAEEFAERLVGRVLGGAGIWGRVWGEGDWVWMGGGALVVWFARWFGEWVLNVVARGMFGMDVLEERLRKLG